MMRLKKAITVGDRKVIVREFNGDITYLLLQWLERQGDEGLKASQLLKHKDELLMLVGPCIVPQDGRPMDTTALGLGALMQLVDGLQEVNQAFLILLTKLSKLAIDPSPAP